MLIGQGPAPAGASVAHFRAEGLDLVPGAGALAAAVPGAVDAWLLLLEDHGTWELRDVLAFPIAMPADGHPVLDRVRPARSRTIARLFLRALADLRGALAAGRRHASRSRAT